jgi:hypothetical protein
VMLSGWPRKKSVSGDKSISSGQTTVPKVGAWHNLDNVWRHS